MNLSIRRSLSVLAMTLLLTGTLAACGTESQKVEPTVTRVDVAGAPPTRTPTVPGGETPPPSGGAASPTSGGGGEQPGGAATTVEIDMVDLAFQPTELTIPANTDVTIKAVNKGALPHTFTIPDVADTGEVASGSSAEVTVNLPAGEYTFDCSVPGHKEAGMVGTLKVVEGGAAAGGVATPAQAASPPASPAEATPSAASPAPAGEAAGLPTTYEIDMVDLAFQPTELTIPANTDVTIKAVNKGALPHTFTIPDVADTGEVASGSSAEVKVNLPVGEYAFDCAVPGHKEAGMVGTLKVVEGGGAAATEATPAPATPPEASPAEATPAAASTPSAGGANALPTTYEMDLKDIAFDPSELTIPANTDVTLNLVNSGVLEHTFDIPGVVESGVIQGGGTGSVTFSLPAGTYEYICVIPGHKEAGMVGKLTVVESGGGATPAASPVASPQASPIAAEVNLDMVELRFIPDTLKIPANVDVQVNLSNSGNLPHNFSIKDKDFSVDLAAGAKTSFTLNLPPGTYDFFCNVPGHESAGMVGKLTVVEGGGATPVATPSGGGGATSVEVDMVDLAFQPTDITIAANTDVTINAVNKGALPHTFTIPDVADTGEVASGQSKTITVNLPPGEYAFDCAVPGHKEAGMVGKLIVK